MKEEKVAAVMFSGGSDSSLCAIRIGQRFDKVHLVTFTRRGVWGKEQVTQQAAKLAKFFGDPHKFSLHFIKTDRLLKYVMYESYFRHLRRHGIMLASMCGLCKVSFHWRTLVYCLQNGITTVADGAVRVANVYPEQNEKILLKRLREVYATFGITYETPIYEEGEKTEALLYELRFNRKPKIKGTKDDIQIICEQQVLYAMFLRVALKCYDFETFENKMAAFYAEKLDMVESLTREWLEHREGSRLERLLEE